MLADSQRGTVLRRDYQLVALNGPLHAFIGLVYGSHFVLKGIAIDILEQSGKVERILPDRLGSHINGIRLFQEFGFIVDTGNRSRDNKLRRCLLRIGCNKDYIGITTSVLHRLYKQATRRHRG